MVRILIADDHKSVRDNLRSFLKHHQPPGKSRKPQTAKRLLNYFGTQPRMWQCWI